MPEHARTRPHARACACTRARASARFCTGQRCGRWNVPSTAWHASRCLAHAQPEVQQQRAA
eukprot:10159581-Alexandrium_andersonii.AAC.1